MAVVIKKERRAQPAARSSNLAPRSSFLAARPPALQTGGLVPLTTIDYPGELAAVVFCQGCPWRCRYCQNGHLLARDASTGIVWTEVLGFLRRRRGLLDAVVFSGGEPTLQAALADAMAQIRDLGFKVGLHTAGCYPERLAAVLPLVDWVGLDIKALPEDYPALTGVPGSGQRAWESLQRLVASGVAHEVRVTVHQRLLPPPALQRLIARLREIGVAEVALQGCRSGQMLDPSLGANPAWADAPRRTLLRGAPNPVVAG
jgi:pyruvate formate lyase activating enzyme